MSFATAQEQTEAFLTGQMLSALKTVDYALPRFNTEPEPWCLPGCEPPEGI